MMFPSFILISLVLVSNFFALSDATSYAFPGKKKSSCGRPVLRRCACLTVNPCEVDPTPEKKKKLVTADDIRKNIYPYLPTEVNLSGKDFVGIDEHAFDDFSNLTHLFLANNKISELPESIFSKLTNLEHLSLAHNDIKGTRNVFTGLSNLKILDLSGNPLTKTLKDNCFYGLSDSSNVLILGVKGIEKIGSNAFGKESVSSIPSVQGLSSNDKESEPKSIHARSAPLLRRSPRDAKDENFRAQVCIEEDGRLQRLDILKTNEDQESNCKEIEFRYRSLLLNGFSISSIKKRWYRIKDEDAPSTLSAIHIENNNIVSAMGIMEELPKYITWLDLKNNKIERVEEGCFEHEKIFSLDLSHNLISTIEDNAIKMPALSQLYLNDNNLKDTKFMATLPTNLISLHLGGNKITEISENTISKLSSLSYLNLGNNRLTTLHSNCLQGATSVNQLSFSNNQITTIEPGAFAGYTGFQIFLDGNNLTRIDRESLSGLEKLQQLNVNRNKITKLERGTLNFPNMRLLEVKGNNITEIEKGALKGLSKLERLDISMNPITKLENGVFSGMSRIPESFIEVEGTPIETIEGGLFDNV